MAEANTSSGDLMDFDLFGRDFVGSSQNLTKVGGESNISMEDDELQQKMAKSNSGLWSDRLELISSKEA